MTQKKTEKPKPRTKVKDLPKGEKELDKQELKKVMGGAQGGGIWLDNSPRPK